MRAVFLLLLAANLALFAWSNFYASPDGATDPEPSRRQVNPESIRLLSGPELNGLPMLKPKPAGETQAPGPAAAGGCAEWGGFSIAEAPRAEQVLEPLALGARLSQRRSEEKAGWWVFIPPQGNRPAAQKKTAELKALGIDDYFILQEESSMRSAQTGERDTQGTKLWVQVRGADAALQARLKEFAKALPGTELRDCQ